MSSRMNTEHEPTLEPYVEGEDLEEEEEEDEVEEDVEGEEDEEEEEDSILSETTWINSFCTMLGHEYFAEVSEDFIEDDFNLTGLSSIVPMYKEALEMILDVEPEPSSSEASDIDPDQSDAYARQQRKKGMRFAGGSGADELGVVETSSELLYGLIHQRYILSRPGMQQMYEKYLAAHFGHCPRVYCNSSRVLPCGSSDTPGQDTVKLYCPCCMDVYLPPNSRFQTVDGAYFGTSFASLFLMTFGDVDVFTPSNKPPTVIPPAPITKSSKPPNNSTSTTSSAAAPTTSAALTSIPGSLNNQSPGVLNGFAVQNIAPGLGQGKQYDMKIYGFKVSERSKSGPRMRWLRNRPEDMTVLDESVTRAARKARRKKKSGVKKSGGGEGERDGSAMDLTLDGVADEVGEDNTEMLVGGVIDTGAGGEAGPSGEIKRERVMKKAVRRIRNDENEAKQ